MQCIWKQCFWSWSERCSRPDADDLGVYRPPCRDHLRPQNHKWTSEEKKGIHIQAWIHWRYTVETQTARGTTQPPECKAKWGKGGKECHYYSGSGRWEWPISNHQARYAVKWDRWGNLQGFNRSRNSPNGFRENKTRQCMAHKQREDVKARKRAIKILLNG